MHSDADEPRRKAALRHERDFTVLRDGADRVRGAHVFGEIEIMHAGRFRRGRDADREVIRQRVHERVEADQGLTQRGRIGGIDAACRDALRIEQRERVFVAIECHDVEVACFTQQMRNALTN